MQARTLSFQFQLGMLLFSGVFWLLGLIPIVNIFTNAIYWVIWLVIFIYKYKPLIEEVARGGVQIGALYLKISLISAAAFILGEIPFVSMVPWDVMANLLVNRLTKQTLLKIEETTTSAEALKNNFQKERSNFRKGGSFVRTNDESDALGEAG